MRKPGLLIAGVIIALAGLVFFLQGLDVLKGSAMSGSGFWAVAGPIVLLAGLAMVRIGTNGRLR